MVASKVRIGIVGVNFGALVHIPAFQLVPELEVVAVCATRQERADQAAKQYNIPHIFIDYRKMLEMRDLDAVSIVSPGYLHYQMTLDALNAGKHVICEKAFTATLKEAQELEILAKRKGLTGMIAHEFRYTPPRSFMKELVRSGYVGKVQNINVNLFLSMNRPGMLSPAPRPWGWEDEAGRGGGMLYRLGSHFIDGLRDIIGDVVGASGKLYNTSPERIDSAGNKRMSETDDSFTITMEFANGAWCTMSASFGIGFGRNAGIEIYGSDGVLVNRQTAPNPSPEGKVLGAKRGDQDFTELPIPPHLKPPPSPGGDERTYSMVLLAKDFVRGVRDHSSPSPSFTDGVRCMEVIDAVQRSSKEGKWVKIR